jgi:hypothetical protein
LEGLVSGDFEYADYFDNSQPWLCSADAVFLVPGWETSTGTRKEIELANSLDIPVFNSLEELNIFYHGGRKEV